MKEVRKLSCQREFWKPVKTAGEDEETNESVGYTWAVQDGPGIPALGARSAECNSHFD